MRFKVFTLNMWVDDPVYENGPKRVPIGWVRGIDESDAFRIAWILLLPEFRDRITIGAEIAFQPGCYRVISTNDGYEHIIEHWTRVCVVDFFVANNDFQKSALEELLRSVVNRISCDQHFVFHAARLVAEADDSDGNCIWEIAEATRGGA
jgi:hypothetical protein